MTFIKSALKCGTNASVAKLFAAAMLIAIPAHAQSTKVTEEKPGLLKRAKITPEKATATALAKVPGGIIQVANIEEEDGKLIFSFDIKVKGKSGIEEVAVDAMNGKVLGVEHETPADEAKEAAKEKAESAKTAKSSKTRVDTSKVKSRKSSAGAI